MPIVQGLSKRQMAESIEQAIARQIPVLLTCQVEGAWHTLHTKLIGADESGLWIDRPTCVQGDAPETPDGLSLGLSFKYKHHKHLLNTVVEGAGPFRLADGDVEAIRVRSPRHMQRVQRRAYQRVNVPRNRSVLATFWPGGLTEAEDPPEPSLTWEGWVTNISAGGFQVRIGSHGAPEMDVGDLVGARIDLGQEYDSIVADAQFRQQIVDERGVRLQGFQFVGLNESPAGQGTLRRVSAIVCEFQRHQDHHKSSVA